MVQVRFGSGAASMYPDYELEPVSQPTLDEEDAIRTGAFGRAVDLRRQLTHIQLSGRLANLVYSMDTTNTDFYAHQYKPVMAFLESPSNGLLIADEVGLGKTIEAGLIWTELRARVDARRLLVVCPKMLCPKWKTELLIRFGVEGSIVDAAGLLNELNEPKNQARDGRAVIVSLQGIRPPKGWAREHDKTSPRHQLARMLTEVADQEPLFDLVVIDEAHYLRNPETSTHQLGHLLRAVTEHVVLLSATPINLKNEDLFSLLAIVDPDNFRYREQFESVLRANEPLVKARFRALTPTSGPSEILEELQRASFHELLADSKQLEALLSDISSSSGVPLTDNSRVRIADRIERVNLLSRAVIRTRKVEVTESRVVRDARVQSVPMSGEERNLYDLVTDAIRDYAESKGLLEGFLLATPQRQLSSCMYAAAKHWNVSSAEDVEELLYEDLGYSADEPDRSEFLNHLASYIRGGFSLAALRTNDSKFTAFSDRLTAFLSEYPTEKVIVFSYFRDTLRYLHERLAELDISSILLMGDMPIDKTEVINTFRTDPNIRVLLSSEVASEGVDLQFCRFLINYDLPWNPMKVEQRIGRLDRLGQNADKIFIWNLVYEDTIDSRILSRLYERLNLFERALGGLEAVIGEEIQNLTSDLLTGRLTREEEETRISQTALALENRIRSEEELEQQASQLVAHSGYILQKVRAAHEFSKRITEDDLFSYVRDYLNRYAHGHTFWQPADDPYEIELKLPPSNAARLSEFLKRRRLTGLTRLATGELRKCRFANKVQRPTSVIEIISQFHPLVRFVTEELERAGDSWCGLICIKVRTDAKLRGRVKPGIYGTAVQRWLFDGMRTEEVLRARVVPLGSTEALDPDESLEIVNLARLEGRDWLEVTNAVDPSVGVHALNEAEFALIGDYEAERSLKVAENADRIEFQRGSIKKHLERKLEIEHRRIASLGSDPRSRGLVIAAERDIEKLKQRFELQAASLGNLEKINSRYDLVCKCLISMEG